MLEPLYLEELRPTRALSATWDANIFVGGPVEPLAGKLVVPTQQKNTNEFSRVICRDNKIVLIFLLGMRPALNDDVS